LPYHAEFKIIQQSLLTHFKRKCCCAESIIGTLLSRINYIPKLGGIERWWEDAATEVAFLC